MRLSNTERGRRLAAAVFGFGLLAYLVLSPQTLFALGYWYEAPGGSMLSKIHPGTYLTLVAYFIVLCSYGNPLRVAASQAADQPLLAVFLGCMLFLLGYTLLRHGSSGAAFVIDTLVMTGIAGFTMLSFEQRRQRFYLQMMGWVIVVNSAIALIEAALQARLVPFSIGGIFMEPGEDHFRAGALLGHPLMNAQATVTMLPVVLLLPVSRWLRGVFAVLLMMSLLAYGGRTSFVVGVAFYGAYLAALFLVALVQGRVSYLQLTGGSVGVGMVTALGGGFVALTGFGDRIFKGLEWDDSANVRARVWGILDHMDAEQIAFGVSPDDIADLMIRIGLNYPNEGLENFWLAILVQFGAVGLAAFTIGLLCLIAYLWIQSSGPMRVALVIFFIVGSSNNSLTTKTMNLCVHVCAVMGVASLRSRPLPALQPVFVPKVARS